MPDDPNAILVALWLSLRIAGCATLLSLLVGLPLAWGLSRRRVPGRAVWEGLVLLPLVLPPTVLGYYLLTTLGAQSRLAVWFHRITGRDLHLVFTWQGATLAACIVSLPLLARTMQASFAAIDTDLLDAARVFGASEMQMFRYVALPLARRGLFAGIGLAFARALGDFGATLMVGGSIPGQTRTLPLMVYDAYNAGDERLAGMLALLLSGLCLGFALLAAALERRA